MVRDVIRTDGRSFFVELILSFFETDDDFFFRSHLGLDAVEHLLHQWGRIFLAVGLQSEAGRLVDLLGL